MKLVEKRNYNLVFYLLAVFIFFVFLGFIFKGENGLIRLLNLKQYQDKIAQTNNNLLKENLGLRAKIRALGSSAHIELLAREGLSLVHTGEVIFITKKTSL